VSAGAVKSCHAKQALVLVYASAVIQLRATNSRRQKPQPAAAACRCKCGACAPHLPLDACLRFLAEHHGEWEAVPDREDFFEATELSY